MRVHYCSVAQAGLVSLREPVRWQQHGAVMGLSVMGLNCIWRLGKGPLYLMMATAAGLSPKFPKHCSLALHYVLVASPHERSFDVIACARKIRTVS